jgi:ABC-type lipoprotein export system ATPase subunit
VQELGLTIGFINPRYGVDDIIKMVREEGAGVLVATHNLALTRHMDRVLTLKDGKLVDYTEQ